MNRMAAMVWSDIMVPCFPIMPSLAPSSCSWRTRGFLEVQVTKLKLAHLETQIMSQQVVSTLTSNVVPFLLILLPRL